MDITIQISIHFQKSKFDFQKSNIHFRKSKYIFIHNTYNALCIFYFWKPTPNPNEDEYHPI